MGTEKYLSAWQMSVRSLSSTTKERESEKLENQINFLIRSMLFSIQYVRGCISLTTGCIRCSHFLKKETHFSQSALAVPRLENSITLRAQLSIKMEIFMS